MQVFDAIIGDPPYGVRAGGKKMVAKSSAVLDRASHIPSTHPYTLTECLQDLLDMAARLLRIGASVWSPVVCILCCTNGLILNLQTLPNSSHLQVLVVVQAFCGTARGACMDVRWINDASYRCYEYASSMVYVQHVI